MKWMYLVPGLLIALIMAAILIPVWLHFYRIKKRKFGKCKIKSKLSRFCGLRKYRILEDVRFTVHNKPIVVPYIVVGIFGVLLINIIEDNGTIYGNVDDQHWVCDDEKQKRWYIPNWVKTNEAIVEQIRHGLSKRKVYKTQIDAVTVFPYRKRELSVSTSLPVIRANKFSSYLHRDRFNKDNNVDIEKMTEIIRQIAAEQ